ncbi:hypothetical protein NITHO_480004 [Nitrolancea hollandica Lb]|uniref:Uncharacterized protein n=1 Tax=Nitrolancea hollandica Lb TaxID=1129897 RepID=I4EKU4_9BACT|nr:hypothetical protein NITHO_480004 [Nitrolancea hollandica Lb]
MPVHHMAMMKRDGIGGSRSKVSGDLLALNFAKLHPADQLKGIEFAI